jgi:hypothetical protein
MKIIELDIFLPEEISKYWKHIDKPLFVENGIRYGSRRWKLKSIIRENETEDKNVIFGIQECERNYITDVLGLTHVHGVYFNPYPIYDPYDKPYYNSFVCGSNIKNKAFISNLSNEEFDRQMTTGDIPFVNTFKIQ